ncbi:MAG: hypothetical protein AAGG48_09375 [Planctomycetota bacterium]
MITQLRFSFAVQLYMPLARRRVKPKASAMASGQLQLFFDWFKPRGDLVNATDAAKAKTLKAVADILKATQRDGRRRLALCRLIDKTRKTCNLQRRNLWLSYVEEYAELAASAYNIPVRPAPSM